MFSAALLLLLLLRGIAGAADGGVVSVTAITLRQYGALVRMMADNKRESLLAQHGGRVQQCAFYLLRGGPAGRQTDRSQ